MVFCRSRPTGQLAAIGAVLISVATLTSTTLHATPPSPSGELNTTRIWAAGGWDHTWFGSAGVGRKFTLVPGWLALRADTEAGFPPLVLQARGYRGASGATLLLRTPWWVGAELSGAASITGARDALGARTALGTVLTVRPGVYTRWFSVGAEATYRAAVATWTTHSDEVKALFADRYPGEAPVDAVGPPSAGWSFLTTHIVRAGAFGGVFLLGHVGLWMHGGLEVLPQAQGAVFHAMLGQLGFYSVVGAELAW